MIGSFRLTQIGEFQPTRIGVFRPTQFGEFHPTRTTVRYTKVIELYYAQTIAGTKIGVSNKKVLFDYFSGDYSTDINIDSSKQIVFTATEGAAFHVHVRIEPIVNAISNVISKN